MAVCDVGFVEHYRDGDPVAPQGAQLLPGEARVMFPDGGNGGSGTVLPVFVDVDPADWATVDSSPAP